MDRRRGPHLRFCVALYLLAAASTLEGSPAATFAVEQPESSADPKVLWTLDTGG